MNNPNPFVPKGSLLEQQSQRRSRLKLGVFCVLAVSVTGLIAMLIQGCKRDQPPADAGTPPPDLSAATSNSLPADGSNTPPMDVSSSTNLTEAASSNSIVMPPPPPPVVVPPPVTEPVPAAGAEYIVVSGDTLGKIAHRNHVLLKDLEAANPGVDSKHLKIKQKLIIPASTQPASAAATGAVGVTDDSGDVYVVKSGDTLIAIARKHGTTVKALEAANNLTTTKIKVNQKLKLPARADAAAAAPADATSVPVPPPSAPAPAPASTPFPPPSAPPAK